MHKEAVEAYDELCRKRKDVLIEESALVELGDNEGITRIRFSISKEQITDSTTDMSRMIHQKRCDREIDQEERKKGSQENTGRGHRTPHTA